MRLRSPVRRHLDRLVAGARLNAPGLLRSLLGLYLSIGLVAAFGAVMVAAVLYAPRAGLILVAIALAAAVIERLHFQRRIARMTGQISYGDPDAKLEGGADLLGSLAHAVNQQRQQQRISRRALELRPGLPQRAVRSLLAAPLPATGLPRTVAVLALNMPYTLASRKSANELTARLPAVQDWLHTLHTTLEQHNALLISGGDHLLVVLGAFDDLPPAQTLRNAMQVATDLRRLQTPPTFGPLSYGLASGAAVAIQLPAMGFTVVGAPVDQALRLLHLARSCPEYDLLCSEETCMALRRLQLQTDWQATDLRLLPPERPAQIVYGLAL